VLEAERSGEAFLLLPQRRRRAADRAAGPRRPAGRDRPPQRQRRALPWDGEVSRLHCEIAWSGGEWTISDDGLSRNGTFVNEERLTERRGCATAR
jgi:pSer/pThr/pTyr-binding forkhead associated (FHA) protein